MLKKLARLKINLKINQAPYIPDKKFDEYGFAFLGLYKPRFYDNFLYTHTRATFYTKSAKNNLTFQLFKENVSEGSKIVEIRVGSSFFYYARSIKFKSILDLITTAIEYNKYGKLSTIEKILEDIPSSIYSNENAVEQIIDSIMEYPDLLKNSQKLKKKN